MPRDLAFEPFDDLMVLHVCRHMRRVDVEEVFALRYDTDAFALYRDMAALGGRHLWFEVVRPAASVTPIALFGVVATSPGCGQAHLIGTDDLRAPDAAQIAARVRHVLTPVMLDAGLHRIEAMALTRHRWAHRFLRAAGARIEGPTRRCMGRDREDFTTFVWLADELATDTPPAPEPTGD